MGCSTAARSRLVRLTICWKGLSFDYPKLPTSLYTILGTGAVGSERKGEKGDSPLSQWSRDTVRHVDVCLIISLKLLWFQATSNFMIIVSHFLHLLLSSVPSRCCSFYTNNNRTSPVAAFELWACSRRRQIHTTSFVLSYVFSRSLTYSFERTRGMNICRAI